MTRARSRRLSGVVPDAPPTPPPRGFWAVLLGTAPGLERFLLASVPALVAGSLVFVWVGPWTGLATGIASLVLGVALSRRLSD